MGMSKFFTFPDKIISLKRLNIKSITGKKNKPFNANFEKIITIKIKEIKT